MSKTEETKEQKEAARIFYKKIDDYQDKDLSDEKIQYSLMKKLNNTVLPHIKVMDRLHRNSMGRVYSVVVY